MKQKQNLFMKIRLKKLLKISLVLIFAAFSATSFAQTSVSGTVTDSKDGTPVSDVTVQVKGTKTAVKTDAAGAYTIMAATNAPVLVFSSVGFTTQQVTAANGSASVKLVQSNAQLQDVVVVAYGTRKKTDLTGSVVSIGPKDFQKGVVNSAEQLLQGKVAGLEITTGGGSAGGGSKIRIRGGSSLNASNDPLIVVDGVPVESNGIAGSPNYLGTINPNDIESISVLKDAASTVLYGSRASNGVILITTKKGGSGKTVYNFNTKYSVSRVENFIKVLTGDEVRKIISDEAAATGSNTFKNKLGTANTDWQKAIYQQAQGFENNLSASGTLKGTYGFRLPFRASIGHLKQDGVLKTNSTERLSTSLNLSPKFFEDHLAVNFSLKYSRQNTRFANEGAVGAAVSMDPTKPIYSGGKNWGGYYENLQANGLPFDLATRNPLSLLELQKSTGIVDRAIGNVQLDYKLHFFPDLHVRANLGVDDANGFTISSSDSTAAYAYQSKGSRSTFNQKKRNRIADVSLFYSKELKNIKSKIDVLALHSYQEFATISYNFLSNSQDGSVIPNSRPNFDRDKYENRIESYLGQLNYSLNDKYFVTASIRRDATSKFSKENRVGYFPGVAVAWKLKNEFFRSSNFVNELKLRASYGETGQQDGIGGYAFLPLYSRSSLSAQYQFGNDFYTFLRPQSYNADLKWEVTASTNIGLDFGILNNRISGNVDVYEKKTRDLIATLPVAPGANFNNELTVNAGNQTNRGIELALNLIPVRFKNFTWNLNVNGSYNETKITNLLKNQVPNFKGIPVGGISGGTGNSILRYLVNYAAPIFYASQQVYDAAGKPIEGLYEDNNRDGINTEDDRIAFKKPAADFLFGLNTQFVIKDFSLGFAAHGQIGNYNYNNFNSNNGSLTSIQNSLGFIGNASTNYLDTRFKKPQFLSNYYIENASFFRLDNINVGYNFGKLFNSKFTLGVNASVQNVLVVTKYSGADPESTGGVDNNIYPRPRIYSVGANINF
jgi:TonB-dependent starch-binding outer membrane protein SusC